MGNMNTVEVVHNTESGGRAVHAVELQPWNLGTSVCFHFCHALLHHSQLLLPNWTVLNGRPSHFSL